MGDRSTSALCATVTADTTAELRRRRDAIEGADLVELRLDTVRDPDAAAALAGRTRPVIVTCRAAWEGGRFAGAEEERLRLLLDAWDRGAEYVDVEWRAPGRDAFLERTQGRRVVLSVHDFTGVPRDLGQCARALAASAAEVIKIAVTAGRLTDTLPLFDLGRELEGRGYVALAMGAAGIPTRLLAARIGSRWSYAGEPSIPGQLRLSRMREEFRFADVRPSTRLYGVVGNPILHSLSPALHNAAFASERLDAVYVPLEAADEGDFLAFAGAIGLEGASVTAPFKLALRAHAHLDDRAVQAGALNTLRRAAGGWEATNTDIDGFLAPLEQRLDPAGVRTSVLGAGGAARAVAAALSPRGAQVTLHARRPEQAAEAAGACRVHAGPWPPAPGSWDLLVNATPVGTAPHDGTPWPGARFDGRLVYDLVYNPPVTRLLREAAAAGLETIGGLDMLVAQARRQFQWWTGRRPDVEVMRRAALKRLAEEEADRSPCD